MKLLKYFNRAGRQRADRVNELVGLPVQKPLFEAGFLFADDALPFLLMIDPAFIANEVGVSEAVEIADLNWRLQPVAIKMAALPTAVTCDDIHS